MTSSTEDQIHIKQSKDVSQEATPVVRKSSTDHQYMVKHEAEAKQVDRNLSVKELPFRSNHKLVKDVDTYFDDEDEQDDLSAESPSDASTKRSLNGASRRDGGAGSSCHQCKSAKDPSALLFCSSTAEKGVRKRRCRKKYCDSCLKRSYPASLACPQSSDNAWCCPSCLGCCVCAACTRSSDESRHDGMVEGINSLNQLHPQILSYLGVNPDRLAELQLFLAHQSGNSPNSFGVIDAQTQSTLTQLIQTMQAHDSVAKSLHQMLMNQTSLNNGQYFPPGQFEQQNGIIESVNHPANTVPMFTDQTQTMVNPALAFSLNNSAQNVSNEWMIPGTPAAKILRAEIDLTGPPMQKPMSDQPLNVSPLHQSINISSNSLMNVSPLQPMRNQSYHSVGCSSTGSPSSTATTSSMHSRPVSPAGFSRSIHSSSDQNYSLISSNPTSEMHTLQAQRLSNQAVDQYAHAVVSGHKWSSVDIECEARRHANLTSSAQLHHNQMDDISGGFGRPAADIEGSSNQYYPAVETRKRAHSACMSDDHVSQHHVSMSRQRVSPPVGIPRSIKNSSAHPRKRSADQAYYPGVAPVHSRKSSQEQLEWEMTRQMQQQSLNQQSMPSAQFSFSPSLNSLPGQLVHPSMQYDLNYSDNQGRRFSCAPPFDVDHQQLLGQPGVNQSVLNMEQQLVDPNVAQHSVIRMNQHNQNGFYNSDIPYNSTANHRADVMAPVIQAQDMIQHLLQLNQAQQSAIYS